MSAKLFFGVASVINGTTNDIEPFTILAAMRDALNDRGLDFLAIRNRLLKPAL